MRKLFIGDDVIYFIPFSEEDLYQDNDDLNIFSVEDQEYNELSGEALRDLYVRSI